MPYGEEAVEAMDDRGLPATPAAAGMVLLAGALCGMTACDSRTTTMDITMLREFATRYTAAAQGFMTAFPDMVVTMDDVSLEGDRAIYRWTLTGTNSGPGGTGTTVRISGYEDWRIGAEGLVAESRGRFDEAEYQRQLRYGAPGDPPPGR